MVRDTPCRRLVPLPLLVSLACAHGGGAARATPLTRDEKALAQAVFWIMRAATDAERYRLGGRRLRQCRRLGACV